MNVYDFDNTIFRGDSTFGFVGYCYFRRPKSLLSIPRTAWYGLLYILHIVPKLTFKENLYHMFVFIPDMEQLTEQYTEDRMNHIKDWYKEQQKADDMIISASPAFLIESFCRRLHIKYVLASPVNIHTGRYDGLNCHGKEKVRRLNEAYPGTAIDSFYSDSYSDQPLADLSKKAYIVKGNRILDWK